MSTKRVDQASRVIKASPQTIYRALLDPEAIVSWRPPDGMTARMHAFDGREGGSFRMSLTYTGPDHAVRGKTSEGVDTVLVRFLELVPDRRVVERAEFESDDPAFGDAMTITTTLTPKPDGTEVTIRCEDVPSGIPPDIHEKAIASTLKKLAAFTE
jgi:uncharacterized protein YndB with AHSA1/START domain